MSPYLQPAYLSAPPPLEITEEEYALLKRSRQVLNAAFSFEENYDLLIGNYLEFESSALSLTTASVARQLHEYQEMFELKAEMNRRAVNFLSSARLFVDQLLQRVGECFGNKDDVKSCLSAEYDSSFEYRFMEALRNHVQHSGSAVHSLSTGGNWTPPTERTRNVFSLEIYSQKRFLTLDRTFKKSVLDECPDKVDILRATRRYLESLSVVHEFARRSIDQPVAEARSSFEAAIRKYSEFSNCSAKALTAYPSTTDTPLDELAIFLDWDDVRVKLSRRNRKLTNLSKSVISSIAS